MGRRRPFFCVLSAQKRNGTKRNNPSSSSSLDDDDDGDEMSGASLEEDAPSHKGNDDRGETDQHLLPNDNNALCLLLKNEDFPQE